MLDLTYIIMISLGLSTAKTDLNSHQPYSSPQPYGEAEVRLRNTNSGYFGFRLMYYLTDIEVRPDFVSHQGSGYSINHLAYSFFLGKTFELNELIQSRRPHSISLDAGLAYIPDDKLGLPARLRYRRQYTTRNQKNFNLSISAGLDYWIEDRLDGYVDQTTFDGDYMMHLTLVIEFPIGARP